MRKASFSRKIGEIILAMQPEGFEFKILEIDNLAMYNQDSDDYGNVPHEYTTFRNAIRAVDEVVSITPEYNRSIPAVLKNAIDVGSMPYGTSSWDGKVAAIISLSLGNIAGFGANHHIRQCLVNLNVYTMPASEAYLPFISTLFDENGTLNNTSHELLQQFMNAYIKWFNKVHTNVEA